MSTSKHRRVVVAAPLAALLLVARGPAPAYAQEPSPADLSERFRVPDGLEVTLWAESPLLRNPTAIDVDAEGRVWVAEAVRYRAWRNPGVEGADAAESEGDCIVVLTDTDGDGVADARTVFAQGPELVAPLGLFVQPGRVYVSCSPDVLVYIDDDGDLVSDRRETFLAGFGGRDHDHGVHSLVPRPDGGLALAVGNAGPHLVEDAAGFALRSGSLYTGGGERAAPNRPGLVSDDGRVWTGGLVLDVGRDGRGLRVRAHNFRNPYEVAFDSYGRAFVSDNDDDGNRACRATWLLEGGNYGFFSEDGSRTWQADRRPGQTTVDAHWHADDPGVAPPGRITGAGGPTGVCVLEGASLGERYDGVVIGADAGRNLVWAARPQRQGAGFALAPNVLLTSLGAGQDPEEARRFRPSDVAVGTDGALYVADWYDPGVGGHLARDARAFGRILRVARRGAARAPVRVPLGSLSTNLEALASPAASVRAAALAGLLEENDDRKMLLATSATEPDSVRLAQLLDGEDATLAARALWFLGACGFEGRKAVARALAVGPPERRALALRVLRANGIPVARYAPELASSEDPALRLELALDLASRPPEGRDLDVWSALARAHAAGDRAGLEALGLAARGLEAECYAALAADLEPDPEDWSPAHAELAWRLHPPAALDALLARARSARLAEGERRRAVDALAFVPDPRAGDALLALALSGPDDVRELARAWIRQRDEGAWRGRSLLRALEPGGREDALRVAATDTLTRSAPVALVADVRGATRLWLVTTDGGDGNGHDWAAWIAPRLEGPAGVLRLAETDWAQATAEWGAARRGRNAADTGPVRVGGEEFPEALGTHARSEIVFDVPPGYETFRARVAPDDGGTTQPGARTSVGFEVWVLRAPDRGAHERARARVLDPGAPFADRRDAARALAGEPEGGLFLIRHAEALGADLRAAVADALFRNPDLGVRALASEHFERPSTAHLPPLDSLTELAGDRARGAELYRDPRAQCSTCHRFDGLGGEVGPDLTAIRSKYGRRALLDSILSPSAAIALGYETTLFELDDGRLVSGVVRMDGEVVVVQDSRGERHAFPAEAVALRVPQRLSTMPEGLALGLGAQDLADLATFLLSNPSPAPLRGPERRLFDGESLAGWVFHADQEGARVEDAFEVTAEGTLRCAGRPIGYLRTEARFTNFELELEWRFDPEHGPGNSGVLLRVVGEDTVWPRSIEAQLQHENAGDIWNIGAFPMQVAAERTEGRRTRKLLPSNERPLGAWNRYRITLDRGRLSLEVNGEVQNEATWCWETPGHIALQSEGAVIEFRDLRLRTL